MDTVGKGSPAFLLLGNGEKVGRTGFLRCRGHHLEQRSLTAALQALLRESAVWLSAVFAEKPLT
jgi:hypothetical protein